MDSLFETCSEIFVKCVSVHECADRTGLGIGFFLFIPVRCILCVTCFVGELERRAFFGFAFAVAVAFTFALYTLALDSFDTNLEAGEDKARLTLFLFCL
ncbi:MAG TPA: hypothetical protein DCE42_23795 [Myxococcales bacterium]|nr:hypothetical protein [Myxococcales bacterium]